MIINKIVELGLESKAKELKEKNKSVRQIAAILTEETKQTVSYQAVHRYFAAQVRQHRHLIERKEALQAKVVEAEIDTISRRNKIIGKLEKVADKAEALIEKAEAEGVDRTVIEGLKMFLEAQKTQISALDSLDKRLGRFTENKNEQTVINIIVSNQVDI